MRALKNFFIIFLCISIFSCKDGEIIDIGGGWGLKSTLTPVSGRGELCQAISYGLDGQQPPELFWEFSGNKAIITPGNYRQDGSTMKVITFCYNGPWYHQGISFGTSWNINRIELERGLPGHAKVILKNPGSYSTDFLLTGWGEKYSYRGFAWIYLQDNGKPFNFWYEPSTNMFINTIVDDVTTWVQPLYIIAPEPLSQVVLKINNLEKSNFVCLRIDNSQPNSFWPPWPNVPDIKGPDKNGLITISNYTGEMVKLDHVQGAPPKIKFSVASLRDKGFNISEKAENYQLIRNELIVTERRSSGPSPEQKQPATWGFIRNLRE